MAGIPKTITYNLKLSKPEQEVITVDPVTGGKKGVKIERFDLIPPDVLRMLARHYGRGAAKYGERNMEKGYDYSKSYGALQRHANAWWEGEDDDPEFGTSHLLAVAWHAITLLWMQLHKRGTDDRPSEIRSPSVGVETQSTVAPRKSKAEA